MTNTTTTTAPLTTTTAPLDAVDADYATAWRAADLATADLVRFADIAATVDAGAAMIRDARRGIREAIPGAVAAAWRAYDVVADAVAWNIADAVADAADGYELDAVAVVVAPAEHIIVFGMLQRANVAVIMRDAGAWLAADADRSALAFPNVADALAYATGHAAPKRAPKRRQRRA